MNPYTDDTSFRERHAATIVAVLAVVMGVLFVWSHVAPTLDSVVTVLR